MSTKKSPKMSEVIKKMLDQEVQPVVDKPKHAGGRPRTNTIDVLDIEVKPKKIDYRCKTGGHAKPGRPVGATGEALVDLREALQESFDRLGGAEFLLEVAKKDLKGYLGLLKCLAPTSIRTEGADGVAGPLEIKIVYDKPSEKPKED